MDIDRERCRQLAEETLRRCEELAVFSEDAKGLTRTFLSPPMKEVHRQVAMWMDRAGLYVRQDAIGNLIGRREGGPRTIFIGSHLDTVRNAGKYDGPLGVLLGIAAVEMLGDDTTCSIEVVGFSEEEGVRFRRPFLGSLSFCGRLPIEWLNETDDHGVSLADAIRQFGGDPLTATSVGSALPIDAEYLEVHIEQGPVLAQMNTGVGIVSAITGQNRYRLAYVGEAGHAGTCPMDLRKDALAAAAEFVLAVETAARGASGLTATVGRLDVEPNVGNVIPGKVRFSLDVRHVDDGRRRETSDQLIAQARAIGERRGIRFFQEQSDEFHAVPANPAIIAGLQTAAASAGFSPLLMNSGAGHDACILAERMPVGMLFVRSPNGISHHPDEMVLVEDVAAALETLVRYLHHANT